MESTAFLRGHVLRHNSKKNLSLKVLGPQSSIINRILIEIPKVLSISIESHISQRRKIQHSRNK